MCFLLALGFSLSGLLSTSFQSDLWDGNAPAWMGKENLLVQKSATVAEVVAGNF